MIGRIVTLSMALLIVSHYSVSGSKKSPPRGSKLSIRILKYPVPEYFINIDRNQYQDPVFHRVEKKSNQLSRVLRSSGGGVNTNQWMANKFN